MCGNPIDCMVRHRQRLLATYLVTLNNSNFPIIKRNYGRFNAKIINSATDAMEDSCTWGETEKRLTLSIKGGEWWHKSNIDKHIKKNVAKGNKWNREITSNEKHSRQEGNISAPNHLTLGSAIYGFDSPQPIKLTAIFLHDLSLNMILNWDNHGDGGGEKSGENGAGRLWRWIPPVGKEIETKEGNEKREGSKNDWRTLDRGTHRRHLRRATITPKPARGSGSMKGQRRKEEKTHKETLKGEREENYKTRWISKPNCK